MELRLPLPLTNCTAVSEEGDILLTVKASQIAGCETKKKLHYGEEKREKVSPCDQKSR